MSLKIVIIGAGEVGFNLARELSQEDYDITIVDQLPEKIKRAVESLDVNTLEGNGASQAILREAGVENADIFLALTRIDEVNLVSCQMARALGAKKIIARLRSTEYSSKNAAITPTEFGIDEVIHPELVVVEELERLMRQSSALNVTEFEGGRLELVGVYVDRSSFLVNKTVSEVAARAKSQMHVIVAINRNDEPIIPTGDTVFQGDDSVYVLGDTNHMADALNMLGKPHEEVKKAMILGAGRIGRRISKRLQDDLNIRLVDKDKAKAWEYAPSLLNTLVLHGDGTDIDFLISENISDMDSFIAVTENEQTNLLTGLLAKHLGARHVVVHLNTTSYMPMARRIGIDTAISKNLVTVEAIMRVIRSTGDRDIMRFEDLGMESLELTAEEGSKITTKPIHSLLSAGDGVIIAAIMRGGSIEIPSGDSQINGGDRVLLFALRDHLEKVEKFFN